MEIGERFHLTKAFLDQIPRRRSKTTGTIVGESGDCWTVKIDDSPRRARIWKGYVEPERS